MDSRKVIHISLKKLILWVGLIILIGAGIWFAHEMGRSRVISDDVMETPPSMGMGVQQAPSIEVDYGYYPYNPGSDITDTREFLKTKFSANIQTRDVHDAVNDVKNAVRDVEGRVDNISSGEKYGSISFVVSKSRFEEFRTHVEKITHRKLYLENISSQNLLGQKQSLEQQTASATSTLASLQRELQTLKNQYIQRVASLNYRLSTVQNELANVQQRMYESEDPETRNELRSQEVVLLQNIESINQDLGNEHTVFGNQNQNIVDQITYMKSVIENLGKKDTQFMNNLETVNGYISVSWISWWDMAEKISPIHPLIITIVLILIILFVLYRRGYIPKVEFV